MIYPITLTFSNDKTALAIRVQSVGGLAETLVNAGLPQNRPTLVLVGGASQLSEEDFQQVQSMVTEAIAPVVQKWQAVVVDGGTDVGVMRLMGQARAELDETFVLVGVCPEAMVTLPGKERADTEKESVVLEPHHTHFVLTSGDRWGAESETLAKVATAIAGEQPSVTVLINGGEITWQDAAWNVKEGRSLIVVEGTGRTADVLAAAMVGDGQDERAVALVRSGLVRKVALADGSGALVRIIEELFGVGE
jgi:SLOG in TRPM, prokaryote